MKIITLTATASGKVQPKFSTTTGWNIDWLEHDDTAYKSEVVDGVTTTTMTFKYTLADGTPYVPVTLTLANESASQDESVYTTLTIVPVSYTHLAKTGHQTHADDRHEREHGIVLRLGRFPRRHRKLHLYAADVHGAAFLADDAHCGCLDGFPQVGAYVEVHHDGVLCRIPGGVFYDAAESD